MDPGILERHWCEIVLSISLVFIAAIIFAPLWS
jgi:hypothetical protein